MLKTPTRLKKEKRDRRVHAVYMRLAAQPGSMKSAVHQAVMKKFGMSYGELYKLLKRVQTATEADANPTTVRPLWES